MKKWTIIESQNCCKKWKYLFALQTPRIYLISEMPDDAPASAEAMKLDAFFNT